MRWVLGLIGTGIDGRSLPGWHDPPNLWTVPSESLSGTTTIIQQTRVSHGLRLYRRWLDRAAARIRHQYHCLLLRPPGRPVCEIVLVTGRQDSALKQPSIRHHATCASSTAQLRARAHGA